MVGIFVSLTNKTIEIDALNQKNKTNKFLEYKIN